MCSIISTSLLKDKEERKIIEINIVDGRIRQIKEVVVNFTTSNNNNNK